MEINPRELNGPFPILYLTVIASVLVDWVDHTGFIAWTPSIKAYVMPPDNDASAWDPTSDNALRIIEETINTASFWEKLAQLYSQESARGNSSIELRDDNIDFIKSLFKVNKCPLRLPNADVPDSDVWWLAFANFPRYTRRTLERRR